MIWKPFNLLPMSLAPSLATLFFWHFTLHICHNFSGLDAWLLLMIHFVLRLYHYQWINSIINELSFFTSHPAFDSKTQLSQLTNWQHQTFTSHQTSDFFLEGFFLAAFFLGFFSFFSSLFFSTKPSGILNCTGHGCPNIACQHSVESRSDASQIYSTSEIDMNP